MGFWYWLGVAIAVFAVGEAIRKMIDKCRPRMGRMHAEAMLKAYRDAIEKTVEARAIGDADEADYWLRIADEREKALMHLLPTVEEGRHREVVECAVVPLYKGGAWG